MRKLGTAISVAGIATLAILTPRLAQVDSAQAAASPHSIADIAAILDRQKPDPVQLAHNRAIADAAPPAGGHSGQFYYRRAQARAALGRTEESIADCQRAIAQGGNLQTEIARYTQLLANQLRGLGHFHAAIEADQGLAAKLEAAGHGKGPLFGAYLRMAMSAINLGDVRQAEAYLDKANALLVQSRAWPNQQLYRSSWESIVEQTRARVLQARGKDQEAELAYRKSQALLRDAIAKSPRWPNRPPADSMESALDFLLTSEGQVKARQGRLNEAEADIRRALLSRLKAVGKYHSDTAQITNSLASLMSEQARFAEAEQLARSAVEIYEALGYPLDAPLHAFALNLVATSLYSQRKYDEAARTYERVDAATESWEPTQAARLRLGFARIFTSYATNRVEHGIAAARQWVERETKRTGENHADTAMANAVLAAGLTFAHRDAEAMEVYGKALPILLAASREDADDATVTAAADRRRRTVVELYLALLARNSDGLPEVGAESFQLAEAIRSRSVEKALSASSARAVASTPALADLVRKEQDLGREVDAELVSLNDVLSLPPEERTDKDVVAQRTTIERLRAQHAAAKRDIQQRFPGYADLVAPKPPSLAEIRAVLKPDEAFLSVHLGRYNSFVWAVRREGPVAFAVVATDADAVDQKVRQLRLALDPRGDDIPPFDVALAHELYAALLEPVEAGWKSAKSLIVVTNGALGFLPLGVLPTAPAALENVAGEPMFASYRKVPWLARTHAVTVMPSAAALRTLRALPPGSDKREQLIGFGDPLFNKEQVSSPSQPDAKLAEAGGPQAGRRKSPQFDNVENASLRLLPGLPDTADELRSIASALGADPAKVLRLGTAANEEAVKKTDLARFRVVVFATHGLVPGDIKGLNQPALALSAPSLSGVKGDGLLTMEEILALKLDADWVVLSACNTGAAAGAGAEAASGLGRAFFYAGTRAVLVTNWSVDSLSARELVTELFRRQAAVAGMTRAEALRQASLAVMDGPGFTGTNGETLYTYAHPTFWAPYSIIGDGGGARN